MIEAPQHLEIQNPAPPQMVEQQNALEKDPELGKEIRAQIDYILENPKLMEFLLPQDLHLLQITKQQSLHLEHIAKIRQQKNSQEFSRLLKSIGLLSGRVKQINTRLEDQIRLFTKGNEQFTEKTGRLKETIALLALLAAMLLFLAGCGKDELTPESVVSEVNSTQETPKIDSDQALRNFQAAIGLEREQIPLLTAENALLQSILDESEGLSGEVASDLNKQIEANNTTIAAMRATIVAFGHTDPIIEQHLDLLTQETLKNAASQVFEELLVWSYVGKTDQNYEIAGSILKYERSTNFITNIRIFRHLLKKHSYSPTREQLLWQSILDRASILAEESRKPELSEPTGLVGCWAEHTSGSCGIVYNGNSFAIHTIEHIELVTDLSNTNLNAPHSLLMPNGSEISLKLEDLEITSNLNQTKKNIDEYVVIRVKPGTDTDRLLQDYYSKDQRGISIEKERIPVAISVGDVIRLPTRGGFYRFGVIKKIQYDTEGKPLYAETLIVGGGEGCGGNSGSLVSKVNNDGTISQPFGSLTSIFTPDFYSGRDIPERKCSYEVVFSLRPGTIVQEAPQILPELTYPEIVDVKNLSLGRLKMEIFMGTPFATSDGKKLRIDINSEGFFVVVDVDTEETINTLRIDPLLDITQDAEGNRFLTFGDVRLYSPIYQLHRPVFGQPV